MSLAAQLHEAVEGDLEWTQELIDQGADVNALGAYGMTVLMRAVSAIEREPAIVQLLIASGAEVNAITSENYTALHCAIDVSGEANEPECVRGVLKAVIDAGADLEAKQHHGWTPLVGAVLEGSDLEVEVLLEYGADPFVTGFKGFNFCPEGSTLLHAAVGEPDKLRALIAAGMDVHALTADGITALDLARASAEHWSNPTLIKKTKQHMDDVMAKAGGDLLGSGFTGNFVSWMMSFWAKDQPPELNERDRDALADQFRETIENVQAEAAQTMREYEKPGGELDQSMLANTRECVSILEDALRAEEGQVPGQDSE